ncbi:hypothetical protein RND71_036448 [Anisodus tanguticus]|uniref:Uncharacterized protein n=1 Tax=Anisodus tanguticus TaxID=243964 RepID=A0AAE1R262_9SOLA|nr:hypothetical protein RND71_036448 [Anisodus tanguticus]
MKFKDGYMISSGQPVKEYIDSAGVLGIKVKILLDWDPKGKQGPTTPLPDLVTIHPPKDLAGRRLHHDASGCASVGANGDSGSGPGYVGCGPHLPRGGKALNTMKIPILALLMVKKL